MPLAFRCCPIVCWATKDFEGGAVVAEASLSSGPVRVGGSDFAFLVNLAARILDAKADRLLVHIQPDVIHIVHLGASVVVL